MVTVVAIKPLQAVALLINTGIASVATVLKR
jgi:hypothetical protein